MWIFIAKDACHLERLLFSYMFVTFFQNKLCCTWVGAGAGVVQYLIAYVTGSEECSPASLGAFLSRNVTDLCELLSLSLSFIVACVSHLLATPEKNNQLLMWDSAFFSETPPPKKSLFS